MRKGLSCSEAGKLGGIIGAEIQKERKRKRVEEYNKDPKLCKFCQEPILYDKRINSFCDHSCAAAFNNKGVRRNGIDPGNCEACGKKLKKSINKYCNHKCCSEIQKRETERKILAGEYVHYKTIREYLIRTKPHQCEICGIEEWNGQPTPITMDHIDGNSENNDLSNLRLICPNCDAQLPTYKGRNKGNGRHARRQRYAEGKRY